MLKLSTGKACKRMDGIDSTTLCHKCGKRPPDEKETKAILLARRTVVQTELERHARDRGYPYCVCLGFQFDKPVAIRDVLEPEKYADGVSYKDRQNKKRAVRGFQEIRRAVGRDPRIFRPDWYKDELATYLVLYSQYPPKQVEPMHALVCKHWRGTEQMGIQVRKQMQGLREKGEGFFSQGFNGPVFVFEAALHSDLLTLKRKGHILGYDSWEFLANKPRRYKMSLSDRERQNISSHLEVLIKRFEDSPHQFPFLSARGFKIIQEPTNDRFLTRLRRLVAYKYLVYACCAQLLQNQRKIYQFWKRRSKPKHFANASIAAIFSLALMLCSLGSYLYYRIVSAWDPVPWYYHRVISRWAGPPIIVVNHHLMATTGRTDMLVQLLYPLAVGAWGIEALLLLSIFWFLFDLSRNETELRAERSYSSPTFRFTERQ